MEEKMCEKQEGNKQRCTAIVLAGGQGKRMESKVHKQYLLMGGRPMLYYSLQAFSVSPLIDDIILVTGKGEETYCREEIVERYGIGKVRAITEGGAERYHSVWNGLCAVEEDGYVFVHDGARPFVDEDIIARGFEEVQKSKACVAAMPVKDTIKISDEKGYVKETPQRSHVWMVQTPQVFETKLLKGAYGMLMRQPSVQVTDDAMVVEQMLNYPIRFFHGSYENIKITTPEDLEIAEVFLRRKEK